MYRILSGLPRAVYFFYLVLLAVFFAPTVSMGRDEPDQSSVTSPQTSVAPQLTSDEHLDDSEAGLGWYLLLPTLILVFVGGISWFWLRSRGRLFHGTGPLRLVQVLALGQRNRLFVVQYEDMEILIAETPNNITLLHSKPKDNEHHLDDKNNI